MLRRRRVYTKENNRTNPCGGRKEQSGEGIGAKDELRTAFFKFLGPYII